MALGMTFVKRVVVFPGVGPAWEAPRTDALNKRHLFSLSHT